MTYESLPKARHSGILSVQALAHVFSFEFAFVLFIFSGLFKGDPRLAWVPVDITLLLLAISGLAGLSVVFRRDFKINVPLLVFVLVGLSFVVWSVGSLLWSDSVEYGPEKAMEIGILVLWSFLGSALIVSQDKIRFYRFSYIVFALAMLYAVSGYLTPANESGFINVSGSNYLALSFIIGCGSVIAYFFILKNLAAGGVFSLLLLGMVIAFFSIVQLNTGGRGPLVSTVITLLALTIVVMLRGSIRIPFRRGLLITMVFSTLLLALSFVPLSSTEQAQTLRRFDAAFLYGQNSSVGDRFYRYGLSLDLFGERPLMGYGIGSWPIHAASLDGRDYPHNIFLEIMVENGLVGLVLFIFLLVIPIYFFVKFRSIEGLLWIALALFAFVAAQASGDVPDNRRLFAFLGLAGFFTHFLNHQELISTNDSNTKRSN